MVNGNDGVHCRIVEVSENGACNRHGLLVFGKESVSDVGISLCLQSLLSGRVSGNDDGVWSACLGHQAILIDRADCDDGGDDEISDLGHGRGLGRRDACCGYHRALRISELSTHLLQP